MEGVAVKPLTVGFHETQFLSKVNQENGLGFWFQLDDRARQQAGSPWGPSNPQALNRYSYVQNNPLKYTDPTGHTLYLDQAGGLALASALEAAAGNINALSQAFQTGGDASLLALVHEIVTKALTQYGASAALQGAFTQLISGMLIGLVSYRGSEFLASRFLNWLAGEIRSHTGPDGVALALLGVDADQLVILNRTTGVAHSYTPAPFDFAFKFALSGFPQYMRPGNTPVSAPGDKWWTKAHFSFDRVHIPPPQYPSA